jgi:hypothetical protein
MCDFIKDSSQAINYNKLEDDSEDEEDINEESAKNDKKRNLSLDDDLPKAQQSKKRVVKM